MGRCALLSGKQYRYPWTVRLFDLTLSNSPEGTQRSR